MTPHPKIEEYHAAYVRMTGRPAQFRIFVWEAFASRFSLEDLEVTLDWINRENAKRSERFRTYTGFRLIQDLDRFEDYMLDARTAKREAELRRQRRPTPRQLVLKATGREEPMAQVKHAGQVAHDLLDDPVKCKNKFQELRETAGL